MHDKTRRRHVPIFSLLFFFTLYPFFADFFVVLFLLDDDFFEEEVFLVEDFEEAELLFDEVAVATGV